MHAVELLDEATARTATLMEGVTPDHYGDGTPCTEWDVHTLANHVVGGAWMFAAAFNGESVGEEDDSVDLVGQDPGAAYRDARAALAKAVGGPDAGTRMVALPFGSVPGEVAMNFILMDTVVHGWDVAAATGQDTRIADDLAEPLLGFVHGMVQDAMRGPEGPFGPAVDVPESAPAGDRLVAFLGRRPR